MLKTPFDIARAAIVLVFSLFVLFALLSKLGVPIGLNQLARVSAPAADPCYFENSKFFNPGPTTNIVVTSGGQQKNLFQNT